jgi:hypothetical protein
VLLKWETDRDAFERCLKYGFFDEFEGVIYRDNGRLAINLESVAYFKSDEEFFTYRDARFERLPEWVLRCKDLTSFNRNLQYIVDFIRRLDIYAQNRQVLEDYDRKRVLTSK